MQLPLSGLIFLSGYIVLVGVASFLQKFSMKDLNPYQVNFLMAVGMLMTVVPALWFKQGSLTVPAKASSGYLLVVVLLSRFFLNETLSWAKILGIALTIAGVVLLSLEESPHGNAQDKMKTESNVAAVIQR